tara:strand:- start:5685 stop:7142 length:1458 start_codon:yes stop_codon:yes gene_type:complete
MLIGMRAELAHGYMLSKQNKLGQMQLQLLALILVIPVWGLWLQPEYIGDLFGPLLAIIASSAGGVVVIDKVAKATGIRSLSALGWLYILKITLVLFFVLQYWSPFVNQNINYGFDPQRYYVESIYLLNNGFETVAGQSLRNVGIRYYYAVQMFVFGANPIGPAMVNTFVSLMAALLVTTVFIHITSQKRHILLLLGLLLIIPETVWFDSITGREAIVTASLVFIILGMSSLLLGFMKRGISRWWLSVVPFAIVALLLVRPVMLLAAIASIALISILVAFSMRRFMRASLLVAILGGFAVGVPTLTEAVGSSTFTYDSYLGSITSGATSTSQLWTASSIGKLFVPTNIFESLLYIPIRMIAHLLAPLPNIDIFWETPLYIQHLVAVVSASLYVGLMPKVFSSAYYALRYVEYRGLLIMLLPLFVILVAVAWGQPFIHERYRIMVIPFLVSSALLPGPKGSLTTVIGFLWYGFLLMGSILYVGYKLF